ncbi:MAG: hypothetical protein EP297_10620 [Gammaproteobacteria bacterium]|nr:MAG: hypothetical protein EP297_10620 [Gammaproteobacteria bacterium]
MMVNPTYVVDHETHDKTVTFDVELGMMLAKYMGTKGHSAYIRPSAGFGGDRTTDGSLKVGYKVVW